MKKFLIVLILSFICIVATSCRHKTIKIVLVGPLSTEIGKDMKNAARLAVDEWNKAAKLKKRVLLILRDDKNDPKKAIEIAHNLIKDLDLRGVVGHFDEDCSIPGAIIYSSELLPMIVPVSSSDELMKKNLPNVFSVCPDNETEATEAAKFAIKRLRRPKVVILYEATNYGIAMADIFRKEILKLNGEVLMVEQIKKEEEDYISLLTEVKRLKPHLIYLVSSSVQEVTDLMKEAKQIEIEAVFMLPHKVYSVEYTKIGGEVVNNSIISMVAPPWQLLPSAKHFFAIYKKRFKKSPNIYSAYVYDAVNVLLLAISKIDFEKEPYINKTICMNMKNMKNYRGASGRIEFTKGKNKFATIYFYIVKDKKFHYVGKAE